MEWFLAHTDDVFRLGGLHLYQSVLPLVLGVLIALPLAQLVRGRRKVRGFVLSAGSLLYTIPSLALFVTLPAILGTRILDLANIIVALTIYAVALMLRVGIDAFDSVDDGVRQAAVAMGYRPLRRFLTVDLPLSVPVLIAGLRVVSVSNISMVSVGALIGVENLGFFFTDGLRRFFLTEIVVGIIATLVLAFLMDLLLVLVLRLLTPWTRAGVSGRAGRAGRSRANCNGGTDGGGPAPSARPAPVAAAPDVALKGA
ncbi:ABC transporter permease [Arthrobacter sp. zg-Y859]|uniref:ABC transporter permease n=1 Tax=Arthrobacter jinronghuae TaxID=2964609 RepID=A0ABT1NNR2_9MICC|nr:ABC transporter permease [Arthrobacter jinronghuae]MCQ1949360.1 ABC transporter permease [Arthrobacter jinronghuae]UWX77863.1 ABC transporter permease [Arthrobacter jinronghuae]